MTEKYNPPKCRVVEPSPSGYIHKTTRPKAQGTCWKRKLKDLKSQRIGESEIVFLVMLEATSMKSDQHDCLKHELNQDNNRHAKTDWGESTRSQPYTKNYRQLRNAQSERNNPPPGRAH